MHVPFHRHSYLTEVFTIVRKVDCTICPIEMEFTAILNPSVQNRARRHLIVAFSQVKAQPHVVICTSRIDGRRGDGHYSAFQQDYASDRGGIGEDEADYASFEQSSTPGCDQSG